ncbi:MAG: hypothetical protein ACPGQS_05970, partial [Bradymonadia bacterium]
MKTTIKQSAAQSQHRYYALYLILMYCALSSLACEEPMRPDINDGQNTQTFDPLPDLGASREISTDTGDLMNDTDGGVAQDMAGSMALTPWFDEHIRPIMLTYCVNCHGEIPAGGGPEGFRLDECEPEGVSGAKLMAPRILARGIEGDPSFMPPGTARAIPESDVLLITRWVELGAPCREVDLETPPPTRHHPEGYAAPALHGASL